MVAEAVADHVRILVLVPDRRVEAVPRVEVVHDQSRRGHEAEGKIF